jgi:hypothetical protein
LQIKSKPWQRSYRSLLQTTFDFMRFCSNVAQQQQKKSTLTAVAAMMLRCSDAEEEEEGVGASRDHRAIITRRSTVATAAVSKRPVSLNLVRV